MKTTKALPFAVLFSVLSTLPASVNADNVYKWVDESGTTHYGTKPPANVEAQKMRISGQSSGPITSMAPKKEKPKKATEAASNPNEGSVVYDADELASYCKSMKERLQLMTAKSRIKQKNKDGSVVMLTEEQRQQQMATIRENIADKCN